jgi:energy-coupling factor transporter ATP-binding protein EcfA2
MSGITIESLHVKNVRLFTELNIKFNRRFNFLVGPNACGKTSVLVCLAHCFSSSNLEYSRFSEGAEFWTDFSIDAIKYRVGLGKAVINASGYRKTSLKIWLTPPAENDRISIPLPQLITKIKETPFIIGAQRNLYYRQIAGIQREKPPEEMLKEYQRNNLRSLYGNKQIDIKQWIINRYYMIDKDWAGQVKKNWEMFISNLPKIAPFGSGFSFIRTGKDFEPVFSLYGKECYLEELSAGYQAVLSIIVDIIAWIENSVEEVNQDIKTASGVVCIDELDVHLHPEWQLSLRQGLTSIFPNLQFIVTTHSPHLMASAGPGEIIRLPKSYAEARYDLEPDIKAYSGWTTDEILTDVMEVESLSNKDSERLVGAAMDALEKKDIQGLRNAIVDLEKISHPDNTIVTVLKTKLASLELL